MKQDTNRPEESKEEPLTDVDARRQIRQKENSLIKKIVFSIIFIGVLLVLVVGIVGYNYVSDALQPLQPENSITQEVEIPSGTSTKGIAEILEEEAIVKDATVFNYYMKTQNAPEFQAGFYQFSPAMELGEIITVLEKGGTTAPLSEDHKILVKEGATVEEIAAEFASKSDYSEDDFLEAVNSEELLTALEAEFPNTITSALENEELMYKLEGYLFPATYDYLSDYTPQDIIWEMVAKTNDVLSGYRGAIENSEYAVHDLLTIASLVEREGIQYEDRRSISGVFYNRLDEEMALQSDISILYALGEHLEYVTIENTEVDSPYNLYQHKGLGPGPFGNPSEEAIAATLNPTESDYLYFLADIETGAVYFSRTFEEHLELQDQYVIDPNEE